jgi:hypothetical protein
MRNLEDLPFLYQKYAFSSLCHVRGKDDIPAVLNTAWLEIIDNCAVATRRRITKKSNRFEAISLRIRP